MSICILIMQPDFFPIHLDSAEHKQIEYSNVQNGLYYFKVIIQKCIWLSKTKTQ